MKQIKALFFFSFFLMLFLPSMAQQCDSLTPSFIVDLSKDPNGVYTSPQVIRDGLCCGASGNVRCIEFIVTLNDSAEGVIFDIFSGAVPGGALFYQINCGSPEAVGQPICLSGPGPHTITFCKPGNNLNEYRIISVSEPVIPDSIYVNDGCTKEIGVQGFDETTVQWVTVTDTVGKYDSYLSCLSGCDTIEVTPQVNYPPFIDIQVCGFPFGGCDSMYTCDTVRVNFFSTLAVDIFPEFPTICFGDTSISIEAIPFGGSPPYTYTWSTGDSTKFANVNTGTFIVELGDTSGCPPAYDTVTVTAFSLPIEANAGVDSLSCLENLPFPLSGSIQAAGGGMWVGNGIFGPSSDSLNALYTPDSAEMVAGVANLMLITTGNGTCPADTDFVSIDLIEFNSSVNTLGIPVSCLGYSDGIALVQASGSRSPFSYFWDASTGSQIGDSAINLQAGNYGVTIYDSAGCLLDTMVEVIQADSALTVSISTTPVTCFGFSDGTASINISGGEPPYAVTWDPAITNSTDSSASNLASDTFSLSITDNFGCVIDTFVIVGGPLAPLSVALTKVNVGCKNGNDGSAAALASGGTAPYSYQWDDSTGFQTGQTAIGLSAGIYKVTVTDTMGCIVSDTISLNEPPSGISFTYTYTQPTCYQWGDGTATVFPTGGLAPYTFLWDSTANNQTTQTATGLSAGIYSVLIFDQNSCLLATPIEVTDPPPLFATAVEIVHVKCKGGTTGSAKVIPTGGIGPYTYLWDSLAGFQTDSIADSLKAGVYAVLVYDSLGCSYVPGIQILEPQDSLSIVMGSIPVNCKGGNDGFAFGQIIGGTSPYNITWSANAGSQTTDTAFNLAAGIYTMSIVDSNACTADSAVTVLEPLTSISVSLASDSTLCFGDSNGLAIATPSGGTAPYIVAWGPGTGGQLGDTAFNLPQGTYSVTITDTNNCFIDTSVLVNQPSQLSMIGSQRNVYCYGDNTAWAHVSISGGVGNYSYQWDAQTGNQVTDSAVGLIEGSYSVVVTDDNGCQIDSSFIISQPDTFLILSLGKFDITCYGDSNGIAFVNVNGGTAPYSYLWGSNANSQANDTAFGLKVGSYMVTVTDSLGCVDNFAISINQPNAPLSSILGKSDLSCFNANDGYAYSNVSGGSPPYSYLWEQGFNTQSNDSALGLVAGYVYLSLMDSNGCEVQKDSILLNQPPEVVLNAFGSDTICIGDSAQIFATAQGGNGGPYTYKLLPFTIVSPPFYVAPLKTTTYGLRGIDVNGCESNTQIATLFVRDLLTDTVKVTSSGDICLNDTVEITASHNGLYSNYTYEWNTNQNGLQFKANPVNSRYYTITVSDNCAATIKDSVFVEVFPLPQLDLDPIIAQGCIPLQVAFSNKATDPDITEYNWDFGDGNTSIDPTPTYLYPDSGTYVISVTVTNKFGCESSNDSNNVVKAFPLPNVAFTASPSLADMRNPIVTFTSLSSPGSHFWSFGDEGNSNERDPVHNYVDTGEYSVTLRVVDANGCENTVTETVFITPYFNVGVPNAFTPNPSGGNGGRYDMSGANNYVFFPVTEGVTKFEMLIFNRWGELIFTSNNHSIGWDGYYKGDPVQQDVYVWKLDITWENGQTFQGVGDVTVFR